ncbi:uncharacterized protein LOC115239507 [Formica exsecta]|uniref:uncharacterized protein LOC115239507 n=1 Tax=Formica exsecta TaxID=72781 RepID=UPI0011446D9F|nr:uncharacterized protein LOC115239507 [Formica exsecta]
MKRCKSSDKISDKASNKENDCSIAKKRKNYQHKFNNNWTEQFPWLSKYKNNYAFCNLCDLKLKIIGFAADNEAVMMGQKSSVHTRLKELNSNIITLSCICHSLHLCSSKATTKLPKSVEEFVRSLYNHFASSSKRKSNLEEYQKFLDLKPYKMLRPSQTRWLSLQAVVDRVLLLWDSFTLYFTNAVFEEDKLHVTDAILNNLNNPVFKIYLIFLSYILDIINKMKLYSKRDC